MPIKYRDEQGDANDRLLDLTPDDVDANFRELENGAIAGGSIPVNLLTDSGRFRTLEEKFTDARMQGGGVFSAAEFMTSYNGSTITDAGQFIFDNNNNGGAAGSMSASVVKFLSDLGNQSLRYGVEYHIASVQGVSGVVGPGPSGNTYNAVLSGNSIKVGSGGVRNYSFWIRQVAGTLEVRDGYYGGEQLRLDGVIKNSTVRAELDDGNFHFISITEELVPGYSSVLPIFMSSDGICEIALPAVLHGTVVPAPYKWPISS